MTDLPEIVVDMMSPVPPFEQIRAQFATLIASGVLRPNDRLPPLRQLAADLGLAVGTTARAYQELEAAKLVRSRRGAGTRVVATVAGSPRPRRHALIRQRARAYVQEARLLGASDDELAAALDDALG